MEQDAESFRVDADTMADLKTVASEDIADQVEVVKAMADERRLRILGLLTVSELCVCDLVEVFDVEYSKLSYHLKQLREAGLVRTDRDGNYVTYELTARGEAATHSLEQFESTAID